MSGKFLALRSNLFFQIYNFIRRKNYKRLRIVSLEKRIKPYLYLFQSRRCEISLPNFVGKKIIIKNETPPIGIYRFEDTMLSCNLSAIWCDGNLYIDDNYNADMDRANYNAGPLKFSDRNFCLIQAGKNTSNETIHSPVLFLGGSASSNYYHWLIEILPKLFAVDAKTLADLKIRKVVAPPDVLANENLKRALERVIHLRNFDLKIISGNNYFSHFHVVYYINSFNNVLINSIDKKSIARDCHFSQDIILEYAAALKDHDLRCEGQLKKIFILRKEASVSDYNKRSYNQNDVFAIAEIFGFSGVYVEDFSFEDQISLFSNATHIIGPSGAAWANIIFSSDHCSALSWLNQMAREFSVYSTLGHYVGCDMRFLQTQLDELGDPHGSYYLNPTELEYFLKNEWGLSHECKSLG